MKQYNVAVIGATGMVGQRFISLLEHHPWFHVTTPVSYTHLPRILHFLLQDIRGVQYLFAKIKRIIWIFYRPVPEQLSQLQ